MKLNVYQFDLLLLVFGILLEWYYYIVHRENPTSMCNKISKRAAWYIYKAMSVNNNYICWEWKTLNNVCASA